MKNDNQNRFQRWMTRKSVTKVISWILAIIIVFTATYALTLPAITIDADTAKQEPGFVLDFPCRDRAALMGRLSQWMLELPAEYEDGIRLRDARFDLHICPEAGSSALRIAVNAEDAEFAKRLAFSARDLARALEA